MSTGMYCNIHLLEIMRLSAFKPPLSYPSSQFWCLYSYFVHDQYCLLLSPVSCSVGTVRQRQASLALIRYVATFCVKCNENCNTISKVRYHLIFVTDCNYFIYIHMLFVAQEEAELWIRIWSDAKLLPSRIRTREKRTEYGSHFFTLILLRFNVTHPSHIYFFPGFQVHRSGVPSHLSWERLLLDRVLHPPDVGRAYLATGGLLKRLSHD